MSERFKGKYRIKSSRNPYWDYGSNGSCFITICTHERETSFGKISYKKMYLSDIGEIAVKYWHEIPKHNSFTTLDEFIVMPDHVHGIININKPVIIQPAVAETMHATSQNQKQLNLSKP